MDSDCIFCKIIEGKIPANRLYEDSHLIIFLDAFPVTRGHTLFVPKLHVEFIDQLPEKERQLLHLLPDAVAAVREMTGAEGINIVQNNGQVSGQAVPHVHFHLIPRFAQDQLFRFPPQGKLDDGDVGEFQKRFQMNPTG